MAQKSGNSKAQLLLENELSRSSAQKIIIIKYKRLELNFANSSIRFHRITFRQAYKRQT